MTRAPARVRRRAPYVAKNLFIRRPILASVISIVILLLGIASIMALPITLLPPDHAAQRRA